MLTDASTQLQQANNINTNTNVYGAVIMTKAIARVHPVRLMNADSDPSQLTYAVSLLINGCYHPHPPSPFVIITQPES